MAKVITFSRNFQKGHPKAGQPTYFVEKILNDLKIDYLGYSYYHWLLKENTNVEWKVIKDFFFGLNKIQKEEKKHTIRGGGRFKNGDYFSPRVWSGKPYNSKQIIIAPNTEVKKVLSIEINDPVIDKILDFKVEGKLLTGHQEVILAKNDGLQRPDLLEWFTKTPFEGQVICWNDKLEY